jgi:hypothetical protein
VAGSIGGHRESAEDISRGGAHNCEIFEIDSRRDALVTVCDMRHKRRVSESLVVQLLTLFQ